MEAMQEEWSYQPWFLNVRTCVLVEKSAWMKINTGFIPQDVELHSPFAFYLL